MLSFRVLNLNIFFNFSENAGLILIIDLFGSIIVNAFFRWVFLKSKKFNLLRPKCDCAHLKTVKKTFPKFSFNSHFASKSKFFCAISFLYFKKNTAY